MIRCTAVFLVLSVVSVSAYGMLASRRRAKMPDFASSNVLDDYINRRSQVNRVSSHGYRRFPTVNHLKVKTNSSTHANEPNVTLKLNIPAAISGFTLDQIDLKYVKKNRFQKSSRASKSSDLFIKYLTNKSSDLHLSSVRRQDHGQDASLEPKESRNEIFQQANSYENQLMRFEKKYPFSLRDNSRRIGKSFDGAEEDVEEASTEIDENDLKALETILTQKTIEYPMERKDNDASLTKNDDLDLKKAFEIFKTIPTESKIEDEPTSIEDILPLKTNHETQIERKQFKTSKSNWFSDNVSNYLSSVIPSLQNSFFK